MEVTSVLLFLLTAFAPSGRALLDSIAYRNRAKGVAEILRAQRAVDRPRFDTEQGRRQGTVRD
ncbi:hypothetical protein [Streptomyces sp. NPDC051993]|uniref:hypothetical protein n=1 Tax=Streptomyces sp. NPDC051993 TaxID=3155286 RepID=UPI00344147A2